MHHIYQVLLTVFISNLLALIIHELGHFFSGVFLNIKPIRAGLGVFSVFNKRMSIKGQCFDLSIGIIPVAGFVEFDTDSSTSFKRILFFASGCAANLILSLLLFSLFYSFDIKELVVSIAKAEILGIFIGINLVIGISNLLPLSFFDGEKIVVEIYQIVSGKQLTERQKKRIV
jgi:membrane-associated protease RseP (regulator of RpoE activity)